VIQMPGMVVCSGVDGVVRSVPSSVWWHPGRVQLRTAHGSGLVTRAVFDLRWKEKSARPTPVVCGGDSFVPILGPWAETLMANEQAGTNDVFYRTTGSLTTGAVSSVGRCAR
jgi:hypothetical protein